MTNSERAAQLWSVLVMAARTQQLLSYTNVEGMTGLPRNAQGSALGDIFFHCQQKGLPSLTSIVLEQQTGRPAAPEFDPPFDLAAEHRRVFIFDWLKKPCPTAHDFQEARDKEEAAVTV